MFINKYILDYGRTTVYGGFITNNISLRIWKSWEEKSWTGSLKILGTPIDRNIRAENFKGVVGNAVSLLKNLGLEIDNASLDVVDCEPWTEETP